MFLGILFITCETTTKKAKGNMDSFLKENTEKNGVHIKWDKANVDYKITIYDYKINSVKRSIEIEISKNREDNRNKKQKCILEYLLCNYICQVPQ